MRFLGFAVQQFKVLLAPFLIRESPTAARLGRNLVKGKRVQPAQIIVRGRRNCLSFRAEFVFHVPVSRYAQAH
jgi:hypothetical protein